MKGVPLSVCVPYSRIKIEKCWTLDFVAEEIFKIIVCDYIKNYFQWVLPWFTQFWSCWLDKVLIIMSCKCWLLRSENKLCTLRFLGILFIDLWYLIPGKINVHFLFYAFSWLKMHSFFIYPGFIVKRNIIIASHRIHSMKLLDYKNILSIILFAFCTAQILSWHPLTT